MKTKQLISSHLKGQKALRKTQTTFLLSILCVVALVFCLGALLDPAHAHVCVAGLGGTGLANMMVIGSVPDISDKYTSGNNIASIVYLIEDKQIDPNVPFPMPNSNREVSTLPMLGGQYMQYFEAHTYPGYSGKGEKGDLTSTGTNTFNIVMGGVRDQLMTFAEEHIGSRFIIIFKEIEATQWEILGSRERPVVLKSFETKNDKDGRHVSFTFERSSLLQYQHYVGNIITAPPVTLAAGAVALALQASQGVYSVPNGAAATYAIASVTGLTATDKGRTITLQGTGTDKSATIADNTSFILVDGATWTAKAGSSISFRVLDPTTLVEVPGSRVQTA